MDLAALVAKCSRPSFAMRVIITILHGRSFSVCVPLFEMRSHCASHFAAMGLVRIALKKRNGMWNLDASHLLSLGDAEGKQF